MISRLLLAGALIFHIGCIAATKRQPAQTRSLIPPESLAALLPKAKTWQRIEAHSDQYLPWNLGETPREIVLYGKSANGVNIPVQLKALGEKQLRTAAKLLKFGEVEFEAWPTLNDVGQLTWAVARWRKPGDTSWNWLPEELNIAIPPFLPKRYDLEDPKAFADVFADYETYSDLYQKPVFGNCIWTNRDGSQISGAWLPISQLEHQRAWHEENPGFSCLAIPQPPRVDEQPFTFQVKVKNGKVFWPTSITWSEPPSAPAVPALSGLKIANWPSDFTRKFKSDLLLLTGKRFERKNSGQRDNQLFEMAQYLIKRYRKLGITARLQSFNWHGIAQYNIIAVIPGTGPAHDKRPIIMADHYDTAYAEKVFDETGKRVAVPGADDNVTATATLLRAAEVLRGLRLRHDVQLVHLTGEEFPADCLGARHIVMDWLTGGQDIGGIVLMDMIGYNLYKRDDDKGPAKKDKVFQVNPGYSAESRWLAAMALAVSKNINVAPKLTAAYRDPLGSESYLYNTDGIIFAWAGFPVILLNEHMNRFNLNRPDYHEMSDTVDLIDWDYVSFVAKTAIETTAQMADQ